MSYGDAVPQCFWFYSEIHRTEHVNALHSDGRTSARHEMNVTGSDASFRDDWSRRFSIHCRVTVGAVGVNNINQWLCARWSIPCRRTAQKMAQGVVKS